MPKIPVRWNDHFPSYHLSFSVFRFVFHGIQCGTLKNKGAIQTFFLLCISDWFYSLLNWSLLVLSLVLVEALKRDFFRSNVYLSNMSIGFIFSLCLHIKKHKNRTACWRKGVVKYQCHTSYTTGFFFCLITYYQHLFHLSPSESKCQTSFRILHLFLPYLKPFSFYFSESGCHESELMTPYVCWFHDGHLVFQV